MWKTEGQDIELVVILLATVVPISQLQVIHNLLLTRSLKALDSVLIACIACMIQNEDVIVVVDLRDIYLIIDILPCILFKCLIKILFLLKIIKRNDWIDCAIQNQSNKTKI